MEPPMSVELQHREDLVRFGKLVHEQGFVSACDGNLSVRLDSHRILATPTGVSKGMMQASDMVVVDLHGKRLEGDRDVSSEIAMHLTIYRVRPDIHAVVHAHPATATGFASAGMALERNAAIASSKRRRWPTKVTPSPTVALFVSDVSAVRRPDGRVAIVTRR